MVCLCQHACPGGSIPLGQGNGHRPALGFLEQCPQASRPVRKGKDSFSSTQPADFCHIVTMNHSKIEIRTGFLEQGGPPERRIPLARNPGLYDLYTVSRLYTRANFLIVIPLLSKIAQLNGGQMVSKGNGTLAGRSGRTNENSRICRPHCLGKNTQCLGVFGCRKWLVGQIGFVSNLPVAHAMAGGLYRTYPAGRLVRVPSQVGIK